MVEPEDDDPELLEMLGPVPNATAAKITAAQAAVSGGQRKRAVAVGRLDSLEAVAAEAGKLYRKARQAAGDDISAITASRLVAPLKLIADLVQAASLAKFEEIEDRLAALESKGPRK